MKKFFSEFKQFLNRGNVLDMAVGIIIGAAFKDIVNSMVNDIITPVISLFFKADFKDLKWVLREAVTTTDELGEIVVETPEIAITYGTFITVIINFIILAFVVFLIVKFVNSLSKLGKKKVEEAPAEPTTKQCPFCKSEIAIEADRCPHCTSEIPLEEATEE